jgi:hypothetical protein
VSDVQLIFKFANPALAAAFLALVTQAEGGQPAATGAPGKSAGKSASKDKPAETQSSASPAPAASATQPPASTPQPVKYEDSGVGELIQKMVQKDRAAAVALLNKFGAKRGTELRPEDWDAFKVEANKQLEPAAAADDLA